MRRNDHFRTVLGVAMSASLLASGPQIAVAGDTTVGNFDPGFVVRSEIIPPPAVSSGALSGEFVTVDPGATQRIAKGISNAIALCARLPQREYSVDCVGERLEALARTMPDTGEYAEAKQIIEETARKVRSLAQQNRAPSVPRARVRATVAGTAIVTEPLTPVRAETLDETLAQTVSILEEAETRLLRSAESSSQRKVAYQQMAAAFGSSKVLLRSS